MPSDAIVPFGKYKGQPIETLQGDPAYSKWLMTQDWFRANFGPIYTLIVNHFGEASETPEHNALQARFLDAQWCQRFAIALGLARRLEHRVADYRSLFREFVVQPRDAWAPPAERADLADVARALDAMSWEFAAGAQFEVEGRDVDLDARVYGDCEVPSFFVAGYGPRVVRGVARLLEAADSFRVECKPIVGDDYPAILRQMTANRSTVLVAGAVQSAAVSYAQLRLIFGASGIAVRTVAEVEAAELLWAGRF